MTLEELLADPERQGKVCGYIGGRPVYHGDKLIPVDHIVEKVTKEYNPSGFLFAFYSFDYTDGRLGGYVTTRIPGFPYSDNEDDHPFKRGKLIFTRTPIESDPEYSDMFI